MGRHLHYYPEHHAAPQHHAQYHPQYHEQRSHRGTVPPSALPPPGSQAPSETVEVCPFAAAVASAPQTFDGGTMLTDPSLAGLDIYRKPLAVGIGRPPELGDFSAAKYGCLDVKIDGAQKTESADKKRIQLGTIPTVNDMIQYGRDLRRVATGDAGQPDFVPLEPSKALPHAESASISNSPLAALTTLPESDESKFKRSYVKEAVLLGEKQGVSRKDMEKILLGIYSIEGFGRIPYDMQSGTSFNYVAPDDPGSTANEDARRNSKTKISSGVGYNQITYPANLHLLNDDHGAMASRLRELGKGDDGKPNDRAGELEEKAKFLEQLQGKLHDELMNFASQTPGGKAIYLDSTGQPNYRLYADFSRSTQPTSFGETGKELTTGLHSLLLDADIGPILQARQLDEDIAQTLRPEFQSYLQAKMLSSKAAAAAVQTLLTDAACKKLTPKQLSELQNQWDKVQATPGDNSVLPSFQSAPGEFFRSLLDRFEKSPMGLVFQNKIPTTQYGDLAPAGAMACNLAGPDACRAMFQNSQASTQRFMSGEGYRLNTVLHGANVDQFLDRLIYQMSQKRGPGSEEFEKDFDELDNQRKAKLVERADKTE